VKRTNHLIWFRRLVVLGAVVGGVTASAAGAVPMLDPQDTPADPVVSHTTPLGLRADGLRLQAIAKAYQQNGKTDVSHSTAQYLPAPGLRWQAIAEARQTNVSHSTALGLRADGLRWQAIAKAYRESRQAPVPDVFERYAAAHPYGAIVSPSVGTERIVDDSFRDAATVANSTASGNNTLDWGAFGIGAGAMLGLALLTGLGLGAVAMHHRAGKLEVS
jgi:hypothetical protein